ncbi:MAG: recombinase family protein [Oscillospiraceae bacterium]|nr:recombinase family protein [Oscillospiraceae bacterium]
MAKNLDADRIEKARQKGDTVNSKGIERNRLRDTIKQNRNGERKVTVIMPQRQAAGDQFTKILRVAAYCRVSTAEEAQTGSFEMQVLHFTQVIESNPRYELARIYKDEGISGTSVAKRKEFQEMIEDAQHGKIDLILTKSISRFGRNIVDILTSLRILSDLNPPVAVNFETDGIDTSDGKNKLLISILSALAELESQQKSEAIKAGIRYRMYEGVYKFAVQNTIGYYRDYTGAVKIEPAEAEVVRYIYDSFLEGACPKDIASALTRQGITSPKGMECWRQSTIKGILSNEKYCGDVLYQKTYTKDFLTHKSAKNDNILIQYHWENCHPAIIERGMWDKAQVLLVSKTWLNHNRKTINNMPKKFVVAKVKSGRLRGFYLIDKAWNKEERSKFINILKSINELEDSK